MDFFEAQARAKKRTSRLLVLFVLAVAGTIAALYAVAVFWLATQDRGHAPSLWNPEALAWVSAATVLIVGLASLYKWSQYSAGGRVVAEAMGGRRIDPHSTDLAERRLLNVVEEMAIASGTPVPAVYVLDDEAAINAFAAGLTTSDAVVAVSRGSLEKLTRDELQGVVGHEFSHILNGDMRLNVRIAAIVFGILAIGLLGRGLLWSLRGTRVRSREKGSGGVVVAVMALGLALTIVGYIGYFFGRMVQAAVSRQREFLADASAVQFTRNPAGIAGALKKIGGYALGSAMSSSKSAELGHFFFAQAFRSGLAGLWATHPPLAERIRAIDASFDGKYFEPPQVVDVGSESFVTAGLAPARPAAAVPPRLPTAAALGAVATAGTLTGERIAQAQSLLDATPAGLREAARDPAQAPALVYALLLADEAGVRSRQRNLVAFHAGPAAAATLDALEPARATLQDGQRVPLLQLAVPALRQLQGEALTTFLGTLDALVHADAEVSTFEFALQKLLTHTLALGQSPKGAVVQYQSFQAVADEIAVVLSALAHAATSDPTLAPAAFAAGAAQLKLIEERLSFRERGAADLTALDRALDKLAVASLPIKQRTLVAAAHVVTADGRLLVSEAELLRAIAAALDVPMPPLAAQA